MWNSCKKYKRLSYSLRRKGINPEAMSLNKLNSLLVKRGITDRQLSNIMQEIINLIEPPQCEKTHCEHYGGQSYFCCCKKQKIPGNCKEHRAFLKRRAEKQNGK